MPFEDAAPQAPQDKFALLKAWEQASKAAKEASSLESSLRDKVTAAFFPDIKDGTNTHALNNGFELKANRTSRRSFRVPEGLESPHPDQAEPTVNDAVDHLVEQLRRVDNQGAFFADRLVKWKPELSNTEYNNLPDRYKRIVDDYLETKYNKPQVEIKAPSKRGE